MPRANPYTLVDLPSPPFLFPASNRMTPLKAFLGEPHRRNSLRRFAVRGADLFAQLRLKTTKPTAPQLVLQRLLRSLSVPAFDEATISHTAMNIAAITGPITKPLSPNIAIPPSVEISTT